MTLGRWLCLLRNFSILIIISNAVVKAQNNIATTDSTSTSTTSTISSTTSTISSTTSTISSTTSTTTPTTTTTKKTTFEQKVNQTIAQIERFHDDIIKQQWCTGVTIEHECPNRNVSFWLYNKNMPGPYLLDETHIDSIIHAQFIPNAPIKVLIHGFGGNKSFTPNKEIRSKYVAKGYNVISVDYKKVVPHPCYLQAATNMVRVGRCFAQFITTLVHTKIKVTKLHIDDFHIVGYCLGAHVAGRAGSLLAVDNLHLPRISALDSQMPLFHGMVNYVSVYTAKFVDAAHTNIVVSGRLHPIGHVDFYFNDAVFEGAVCKLSDTECYTGKAATYFAESINTPKPLCGYDLFSMTKFAIMGEYTPTNVTGMYLVLTNKKPPYAKGCVKDLIHKEYPHYWVNATHYVSF